MSDDALFDVFDQEEPTPIVDLPTTTTTNVSKNENEIEVKNSSNEKRTWVEDESGTEDPTDQNNKRTRTEFIGEPTPVK